MSITYDYRVNITGQALGPVVNTASTSVSLSTLDTESNYEFRVRQRQLDSGVIYYSPWALGTFQTVAVAAPVIVNLGLVSHSVTLNAVTPVIVPPEPTSTTTYSLRVEQVGVSTTFINNISPTNYQLTGLVEDAQYNVSVRQYKNLDGALYYTPWSQPVNFTAESDLKVVVNLGLITHSVTLNDVIATVGAFIVDSFNYDNTEGQPFRVFGTMTKNIQSMTVTIDGSPMSVSFTGNSWEAIRLSGALQVSQMEELDGPQTLNINGITLEFA